MDDVSLCGLSILRAVSREPWRVLDGAEVMERIFASTIEEPVDNEQICRSVAELEAHGLLLVVRDGIVNPEFDFATVRISDRGLSLVAAQ
jgi:hypothetical protein